MPIRECWIYGKEPTCCHNKWKNLASLLKSSRYGSQDLNQQIVEPLPKMIQSKTREENVLLFWAIGFLFVTFLKVDFVNNFIFFIAALPKKELAIEVFVDQISARESRTSEKAFWKNLVWQKGFTKKVATTFETKKGIAIYLSENIWYLFCTSFFLVVLIWLQTQKEKKKDSQAAVNFHFCPIYLNGPD